MRDSRFITQAGAVAKDPMGMTLGTDWSEDGARQVAAQMSIELTPEHWDVLHFLRDYYRLNGQALHARTVLQALEQQFAKRGGRKFLYRLFPGGAVTQATRIAGLPVPRDSVDPSFGSAM